MDLQTIMNLFSDLIIIIKDEHGNIIHPTEPNIHLYVNDLQKTKNGELYHPETQRFYKEIHAAYEENNKKYFITRYMEITEYKRRERELQTDETTGLTIKKAAYKEFNEYIKQAIETGEEFSTIITDADFFKKVNDKYGHLAGDYVLRYLADTIVSQTRHSEERPKDIVGRIGGEEYLVVLKNIPATVTLDRMNSIRKKIADTSVIFEDQTINITCSFGVVHIPSKQLKKIPNNPEKIDYFRSQVLHTADLALYQAKESGRNNVQMKRFVM